MLVGVKRKSIFSVDSLTQIRIMPNISFVLEDTGTDLFKADLARRVRNLRAWELQQMLDFYHPKAFPEFKKRGSKEQMVEKIVRAVYSEGRSRGNCKTTVLGLER